MLSRSLALLACFAAHGCFYNPEGTPSQPDTTTGETATSASIPTTPTTTDDKPACGNGKLEPGEQCDDGNATPGDGCEDDCTTTPGELCGNGTVDEGEECDDGNDVAMDGCENNCTETQIPASCGDGIANGMEECDDGNDDNTDACTNTCKHAVCGDGIVHAGAEACDDGNAVETDDCSSSCEAASCGDGVRNGEEECDDGNLFDDDDCANECVAPRIVFATATTYTGDLGGLDGADAKCAEAAQFIDLPPGVQWSAWLSDATADPATGGRFDTLYSGYYKLTTGAIVAHGWGELTTLSLAAAIGFDETGDLLDLPAAVWSNTFRNGTRIGSDHCDDWTSSAAETLGRFGVAGATNTTWSDAPNNNPGACSQPLHLYCFQQTAPP